MAGQTGKGKEIGGEYSYISWLEITAYISYAAAGLADVLAFRRYFLGSLTTNLTIFAITMTITAVIAAVIAYRNKGTYKVLSKFKDADGIPMLHVRYSHGYEASLPDHSQIGFFESFPKKEPQ